MALASLLASQALAQSCSLSTASASVPAPSVAPGYEARLVATGLYKPRGITFDAAGNLLVVQQGSGVVAVTLNDQHGSCVAQASKHTVINDTSLNHGIALSHDGRTLYVSSAESVYRYTYIPTNATIVGSPEVLVANMTTSDHTTRTLTLSNFANDTLLVSRGSTSNIDPQAEDITTGHSQIKSFNISSSNTMQNFNQNGTLLGWGLRNDVGVAEHPRTGGIWSVENSADEIMRDGQDVHQNNPAEELNYLGTLLNNTSPNQGSNFGYPECFTAWNVSELPMNNGLQAGEQFALAQNSTSNDTYCRDSVTAPRLGFAAHMAPLDIKFNSNGSEAWVSFHGSWDRMPPQGYKVGMVAYGSNGEPIAPSNSTTALMDIVSNVNLTACPSGCFRPVAMAWDASGRLWFSSDSTGEVYLVTKAQSANGSVSSPTPTTTVPNTVNTAAPGASTSSSAAALIQSSNFGVAAILVSFAAMFVA